MTGSLRHFPAYEGRTQRDVERRIKEIAAEAVEEAHATGASGEEALAIAERRLSAEPETRDALIALGLLKEMEALIDERKASKREEED